jgi:surfactin synthase thioesterase subunit
MSEVVLENAELMELLLPILRADFAICETYEYHDGRPLDCPISALGGLRDQYVDRADLEAWRQHTSASFSVRMFPGGHFYLNSERQRLLAAVARELLDPPSVAGRPGKDRWSHSIERRDRYERSGETFV